MRNIIIDIRLLGKGGLSGIEEYTRNLVSKMLEQDSENRYTLFYNGFRKAPLSDAWSANPKVKVVPKSIPNKIFDASTRFLGWPKVENLVHENRSRGDLVFSPHFNILETNLPHVITFHDLSFLHHPDFFSAKQKFWHWLQDYKRQARKAAKIIAVSEFTKSDLINFLKIPDGKIEVIYSGVNADFVNQPLVNDAIAPFTSKFNKQNKPHILYLGTVEPRKNVPAIISAFDILKSKKQFRDLELIIAGSIGWLASETLKAAKKSPYSSSIKFCGPVTEDKRLTLYKGASVFVYPSFFEGFGFPPLEAQSCGTPVVASNRTSLPEILGDSAILIDPWRYGELAEAIERVLISLSAKEELVSKGFENVKKFTWEKTARETINVFRGIM